MRTMGFLFLLFVLVGTVSAQQSYDGVITFDYPDGWTVTEGDGTLTVGNAGTTAAIEPVQPGQISIIISSVSIAAALGTPEDFPAPSMDNAADLSAFYAGYFTGVFQIVMSFSNEMPVIDVESVREFEIAGYEAAITPVNTGIVEFHIIVIMFDEPMLFSVTTAPDEFSDFESDVMTLIESVS